VSADDGVPPVLLEETADGVRILTLNRPDKKNALSGELVEALVAAFEAAAVDDDVRVVGLTGAGDAFCAGADLTGSAGSTTMEATIDRVVRLVKGIRIGCEKPVVAGIGGLAIGAGLSLALCTDMRIASSAARFHPGYSRLATSPDVGLSWTLPQAIGRERALRFLLEPEMRDAPAALQLGLVGEVVAEEDFATAFNAYCTKLAGIAPLAAQQTKHLVNRAGLLDDLEAHLREELTLAARALRSDEGRAAIKAVFAAAKPRTDVDQEDM
jgi:2-(1,2-epoxy-1,2-dihydrophenyl)acetyl-CoA isomerase